MINKELLTALRGDEYTVLDIDYSELEDNKIGYMLDNEQWYYTNVYELAHKCKEWLYDNFYKLHRASEYGSWHRMYFEKDNDVWVVNIEWSDEQIYYSFIADTEHESIFKACEWILRKIK